MNFIHLGYLLPVLFFLIVFIYIIIKTDNTFFQWVEDHWFLIRSRKHKISTIFYILGIGLLLLSLLDLRGPEKKISAKTSGQKTILLIDNSASMLVEDVRPNRFNKALFLAKHYVKRAVGQKLSVVVFSDGTKKIVPFTDDLNLIDARIDTLKNLNLNRGGTGLSLAIKESVQYFRETSEDISGNILVFTDAEETDDGIETIEIPSGISVGIVGVGTSKGGPIPERDKNGVFKRNKSYKGKVVISKLNSNFLQSMESKIENFKYWVATSYSLPTQEILSFFSNIHEEKNKQNDFRIRPVMANWLLVPGVLSLIFSFLLRSGRNFSVAALLLFFCFNSFSQVQIPGMPNIPQEKTEEKEPVKSDETLELEEAFAKGELDKAGKRALATKLLEDGFPKEASALYEEVLEKNITKENLPHKFNQATALLKNKGQVQAINQYNDILKYLEKNPSHGQGEIEQMTKTNILKALQSSGNGSGKGEDDSESDEQEDSDQQNQGEGKGKENDSKDQQKKDQEGNQDKEKQQKNKDNGNNGQDKKNEQQKNGKDKEQDSKPETGEEKKKRKKKLPALLKQLISDDNKLQKKLIDAKTTERKSREKKDW